MVGNVARNHRPRIGIQQPLKQRYECLREQVTRTLPDRHPDRSTLQLPCDEWSCDALQDALDKFQADKLAAGYEPPSPPLKAALDEISDLQHRYARAHAELRKQQHEIRLVMNSRAHLIMQDIPVNALDEFAPVSLSVNDHPRNFYSTIEAARRAAGEWLTTTMFIEGLVQQNRKALEFSAAPADQRALMLINKLYDRIEALEQKLLAAKPKQARQTNSKRPASTTRSIHA